MSRQPRCPYLRTNCTREARGTSWTSGALEEEEGEVAKWWL